MLFIIDDTIATAETLTEPEIEAIEHIISMHRCGHHLIMISPQNIHLLSEKINSNVGNSFRKAIAIIKNKTQNIRSLSKFIDSKVIIYRPQNGERKIYKENNIWHIPLEYFHKAPTLSTIIMGEDPLDADVYIELAKKYLELNQWNDVIVSARPANGGGSVTPKSFEKNISTELAPCLCITDSDKIHPQKEESSTSKKCRKEALKFRKIAEHYCLPVRELENIIPLDFFNGNIDHKIKLLSIENNAIDSNINPSHWDYFDIKEGINLFWINNNCNEFGQIYWKKAKKHLTQKNARCQHCQGVLPKTKDKAKCDCLKIEGFGSNVLEEFLKFLKDEHFRKINSILKSDARWMEIAKIVFEYTIAPRVESVNKSNTV